MLHRCVLCSAICLAAQLFAAGDAAATSVPLLPKADPDWTVECCGYAGGLEGYGSETDVILGARPAPRLDGGYAPGAGAAIAVGDGCNRCEAICSAHLTHIRRGVVHCGQRFKRLPQTHAPTQ